MFQIETISAKMLDYYVERSDAVIIDLRDPAAQNIISEQGSFSPIVTCVSQGIFCSSKRVL